MGPLWDAGHREMARGVVPQVVDTKLAQPAIAHERGTARG